MGVMSCHRNNCENIMCTTYVDGIGYVCDDCKDEFKTNLEAKGIHRSPKGEIKNELELFMNTRKGFVGGDEMSINEFFKH